ncbi:hypothetical protein LTR53_009659, partial [Teratosphaeriaceae sp. CCFEE 6253]
MPRSRSFSRSPRQSIQAGFSFFSSSQQPAMPNQPTHASSSSTGDLLAVTSQAPDLHRSLSSSQHQSSLRGMRRLETRRQMEEINYLSSKARAQNLNPPVDLRLLDYVTPYDDNLMCPICRCPFVDPVVLTECDHCFCRDCIRQTWTSSYTPHGPRGDCPSCRTPAKLGPRSATSRVLVNILDDLLVRCPKSEDGCAAEVKRGEVQDHVGIYCPYARQECSSEDCELPVRRKDAERGCLHYGVSCLDCRTTLPYADLATHWATKCPDRRVLCTRCAEPVLSRALAAHTAQLCPAISLACPGASLGCTSRGKRSTADVHAQSCTFARLAPVVAGMRQRMEEQEVAQRVLGRKVEVLEQGFGAMREVLCPTQEVQADDVRAEESRIPLLLDDVAAGSRLGHARTASAEILADDFAGFAFPAPPASRPASSDAARAMPAHLAPLRPAPPPPGPRPEDLPA